MDDAERKLLLDDPIASGLKSALTQRLEIDFNAFGTTHRMKAHVLYIALDGSLKIAGYMGDLGLVKIPVSKIENLVVSPRYFNPDPSFYRGDSEYDNAIAFLTGI